MSTSSSSSSPSMASSDTTNSSSPTTSTTSSTPSSYKDSPTPPWIIYHLVERTIPCELPLRIMFSFNSDMSDERSQKLPELRTIQNYWDSEAQGKLISEFFSSLDKITPSVDDTTISKLQNPSEGPAEPKASTDNAPGDRFMDTGNETLLDIDFATLGVPIKVQKRIPALHVLNFVRKAFPEKYEKVQFEHGLTALDYLRDLEFTRRDKLRQAAERLNITLETWKSVLADYPDALKWIELVQKYELIIEEGYANIFIDLRIWKMVSQLKSTPFHKPSVLAMLNTLFPPVVKELPNDRIQPKVLHQYRNSFFRYITAVEANGPLVINAFEQKLQKDGNRHSWRSTWDNLMHYMELADQMIKQAQVAIDLGIEMFVGGNYTYRSPLGLLDLEPSSSRNHSTTRLVPEATFDSSFDGPSTRSRRMMMRSLMSFRSHSRSRVNMDNTTSTVHSNLPQNESFDSAATTSIGRSRLTQNESLDSVATTSTLVNTQGATPTSSFEGTATATTSFSSIALNARRSIYAAHNIPMSAESAVPPLPKLDTEAIRRQQRTVPIPVIPFVDTDSPAAQHEAFTSTIIPKDARKILRRRRSDGNIDLNIRPSSLGGLRTRTEPNVETGQNSPKMKGEKMLKKQKSIFDLRRPVTSHGDKAPEAKDKDAKITAKVKGEKMLKEKKNIFDLLRPATSNGENSGEWKQPLKQKLFGPELRPTTSHGEKTFGSQKHKKTEPQSPVSFGEKSLRGSNQSPEEGPLPAPPNRASTFPVQRPTTSHGERRPPPINLGATVVRDFASSDTGVGASPLVGSPKTVQFDMTVQERSGRVEAKHNKRLPRPKPTEVANTEVEQPVNIDVGQVRGGNWKHGSQWLEKEDNEVPAPLGELRRERTPSFYYSHMDSPSMPPPLSLGRKKLDPGPEVLGKPPPSPATSASSRKPIPSSPLVSSFSASDLEVSTKPPASSFGRRVFSRKPAPTPGVSPKSPLPSDGLAFLSRPYEDMPETVPKLVRKRPSLSALVFGKSEENLSEPNTPGKYDAPTKPASILKSSKSMESFPKAEVGSPQETPTLKSKRSFGESLRAKFNMSSTDAVDAVGSPSANQSPKKPKTPKPKPIETRYNYVNPKYSFNKDFSDAAKVQRGELEVVINGWKPSYMIKDQSVPRTPRGLDSPHFEKEPEYAPGTVALPQREVIASTKDDNVRIVAQGGKYGQGQYVKGGDWFPKDEESLAPQLRKQVHVRAADERITPKERFIENYMLQRGIEKDERVKMRPILKTSTEERLGPMIEEIKMLVRAADDLPTLVSLGTGENRPNPTDRGDEKSYFEDNEPKPKPQPKPRLRVSKSTGDLRLTSTGAFRPKSTVGLRNNSRKKLAKKSAEEVRGTKGIKTADISSPRPVVSLPDWDEKLETNLSKEHTRKHLMEKARAEKGQYYLDPPKGDSVDRKLPKRKMRAMIKFQKLEAVKEENASPANSKAKDDDEDSDETIVPKPKRTPIVKKVRILSQATREYGREFEQPRATPKPPKVPEGRKMREEALLWSAEEREKFREREMNRQKRGTLRMLFKGDVEDNEEDWG